MKSNLLQLFLMACSCTAVMLLTSKNPRTRAWGCFVGFCGQPLWFATAYMNWQWGIMLMCFWYAGCYIRGFFANRKQIWVKHDQPLLSAQET